jgi:tRNA(His) 5'-end guanylyltransferase
MNSTLQYLCKNIQGCKFGYTQSDEISLLLTDYDTLTTDAWFGYNVQKMASIAASMATLHFNQAFRTAVNEYTSGKTLDKYDIELLKAKDKGAMFDARCFNIPTSEITNYFISRQQDATRNAIQMLGQTHFSSSQLHKKSTSDIQEMLWSEKNINFNDMPIEFKRGVCCYKRSIDINGAARTEWYIDKEGPIFTQDRDYVERCFRK